MSRVETRQVVALKPGVDYLGFRRRAGEVFRQPVEGPNSVGKWFQDVTEPVPEEVRFDPRTFQRIDPEEFKRQVSEGHANASRAAALAAAGHPGEEAAGGPGTEDAERDLV